MGVGGQGGVGTGMSSMRLIGKVTNLMSQLETPLSGKGASGRDWWESWGGSRQLLSQGPFLP